MPLTNLPVPIVIVVSFSLVPNVRMEMCLEPKPLPLSSLGAACAANSFATLQSTCEKAIDGRLSTFWMPSLRDSSHSKAFFEINFLNVVLLNRIAIAQVRWSHGHAAKIRLDLSNGMSVPVNIKKNAASPWDEFVLPHSVQTSKVRITVEEVTQLMFGGFKEVKLFGCWLPPERNRPSSNERLQYMTLYKPTRDYEDTEDSYASHSSYFYQPATYGAIAGAAMGMIFVIFLMSVFVYSLIHAKCCRSKGQADDDTSVSSDMADADNRDSLADDGSLHEDFDEGAEVLAPTPDESEEQDQELSDIQLLEEVISQSLESLQRAQQKQREEQQRLADQQNLENLHVIHEDSYS